MKRVSVVVSAAASLLGITACGTPVVDGNYEGETLLEAHGLVCAVGRMNSPSTAIGVAWKLYDEGGAIVPGETGPVETRYLPADFELDMFESPPPATTSMDGSAGAVGTAVGIPILYDDVDGDGTFSLNADGTMAGDDRLLGVSREQVVLYVEPEPPMGVDMPQMQLSHDGDLPLGYQLGTVACSGDRVSGFEVIASDSRIDVWLLDYAIDGFQPTEELVPQTCLTLF